MFTMDETEPVAFLRDAFAQMVVVAARVGDDGVSERPFGPATNSIAALITHSCGVCGYWLGHVALGRPTTRHRAAEFEAVASLAELEELVRSTRAQVEADLAELAANGGSPHPDRDDLPAPGTDAAIVLHVFEEVYQHLGHMDVTADALLARRR